MKKPSQMMVQTHTRRKAQKHATASHKIAQRWQKRISLWHTFLLDLIGILRVTVVLVRAIAKLVLLIVVLILIILALVAPAVYSEIIKFLLLLSDVGIV